MSDHPSSVNLINLINLGFSLQLAEVDQNATKRLMAKPEFADKMQMRVLRLDMESAAVLFLSNNMHHRQWMS
jgi:hypothetical protein